MRLPTQDFLSLALVAELNLIVESVDLFESGRLQDATLSEFSTQLVASRADVTEPSVPLTILCRSVRTSSPLVLSMTV